MSQFAYPFQDPNLPLDTRVNDLISRLALEEKVAFLHQRQPAIARLGIPEFRTGGEALHGVAWLGTATVFPQAIGLASTWNIELVKRVGSVAGDEVRGYYYRNRAMCGNVWSPVVDLLRDPRAGRNEEGYSEDPFLTGQMSIAYAGGLRGDDPFYLKTAPTLKHFFAYNNEDNRDTTSSNVDPRNLREYYLKAFQAAMAAGAATCIMTSYNLVNGRPNTVSLYLNSIVRQWTAQALMIVSDAYAPSNIAGSQHYYATPAEGHAAALKAGLDSFTDQDADPPPAVNAINEALSRGLLAPDDIDNALRHIFSIRFRLGEFDPPELNPYSGITDAVIDKPEHRVLAREAACQSIVLLKNDAGMLPFDKHSLTRIAVIGPRADEVLLDWYSGTPPYAVTPLAGIQNKVGAGVRVDYAADDTNGAAVDLARSADVAIVFVGNRPQCEGGWAGHCPEDEGKESIDRTSINLNPSQEKLIQEVYRANPRTVVVLISSFPYAINWADRHVPAIVWSSHGGQELGTAVADVLFGDYAPAGRLTQTWYSTLDNLPGILEYDIIKANRTYWYFDGAPLYPFGHGLTYTTFDYRNLRLSAETIDANGQVTVSVEITNTGSRASDEVVQLYVHAWQSRVKRPIKQLKGFSRLTFQPGETKTVRFTLPASELAFWDVTRDQFVVESGRYDIMLGRSSANIQLTAALTVNGETIPRRQLTASTRAENYDDYHGIRLVDETKVSGTAVGSLEPGGWIAFQDVDFGSGLDRFVANVSKGDAGSAHIEIRLDSPSGTLIGAGEVPGTGDWYNWIATTTAVNGATGVHAVYLVLKGSLRIRSFYFCNCSHSVAGESPGSKLPG